MASIAPTCGGSLAEMPPTVDNPAERDGRSSVATLASQRTSDGLRFRRDDVEAFAQNHRRPAAVVGYDVTFSVPKSVSLLWAVTDSPAVRDDVTAALDAAVRAGLEYLEANAAWVRTGPIPIQTAGLLGAAYLHATNRNLEPQLHTHVVIANRLRRSLRNGAKPPVPFRLRC